MAKIYKMNDYLSPQKVLDNRVRLFDRNFEQEMCGIRAEDELVYAEDDLTSLGMPVLCTIPPLPTLDEVSQAMQDTLEIERFIARAKQIVGTDKEGEE